MSETTGLRPLTVPYCQGNGVDIGSGGDPVVPWAIQVELPPNLFKIYSNQPDSEAIEWRGDGCNLPFKDAVLDFVYSSHLLEDYLDWTQMLTEWVRVLKPGGYLVVLLPDKARFRERVRQDQGDNGAHKHESYAGELTSVIGKYGAFSVLQDRIAEDNPSAYSILFVAQKLS